MLLFPICLTAQFSEIIGKKASGLVSLYGDSDSNAKAFDINYAIDKEKLVFKSKSIAFGTSRYPYTRKQTINSFNIGIGLKDFNFEIFEQGRSPSIDIGYSLAKVKEINPLIGNRTDRVITYSPTLSIKTNNYFKEESTSEFLEKKLITTDLGVLVNWSYLSESNGYASSGLSLNGYGGYTFNNIEDLAKKELCNTEKTGKIGEKEIEVISCSEGLFGETTGTIDLRVSMDITFRITKPFSADKIKVFNQPALFWITRLGFTFNKLNEGKGIWRMGISLANSNRTIFGSFLIDMFRILDDVDQNKFIENPPIQATIGIPISGS